VSWSNEIPTFERNILPPSSGVQGLLTLVKMKLVLSFEMLGSDNCVMQHSFPEEQNPN